MLTKTWPLAPGHCTWTLGYRKSRWHSPWFLRKQGYRVFFSFLFPVEGTWEKKNVVAIVSARYRNLYQNIYLTRHCPRGTWTFILFYVEGSSERPCMLWSMDTAYKSAALGRMFLRFLDAAIGYLHSLAVLFPEVCHSKSLLNEINPSNTLFRNTVKKQTWLRW